jgi:two-component system, OmpR family, response regulator
MKILLVEDDAGIARTIRRGLTSQGYELVVAGDGEEGMRQAASGAFDLVLLDIALPGMDGHSVLRGIRAVDDRLPVIMLTARDELREKVGALERGADDYITKPFAFEELTARIKALSRRAESGERTLELDGLRIDLLARQVWRDDKVVELSTREFNLLEYFLRHRGQVLTREQILAAVWGFDFDPGSNVVDVYVRYLRPKIDGPGQPSRITTIRGAGYRFEAG